MKVISEGYPKDDEILIDSIQIKYYQPPDCIEDQNGDGQELILSTRDGGGGPFININTKSWSISSEQDMLFILNDFKKRAGIND